MHRPVRASLLGALAALATLICGSALVQAQEPPNFQYRLHYSPAFTSHIDKTPFDTTGKYGDEPADMANKIEAEVVMFRYFGLSVARIPFYRQFKADGGQSVDEHGNENLYSVTLYATQVQHDSWNLFIGTGWGSIPEYRIKIDGERVDTAPLDRNLQLRRVHGGIEYTWDRLGVRLEVNRITAREKSGGQKAELDQVFQYLTFFIPFN
jgi:hypothetical protein